MSIDLRRGLPYLLAILTTIVGVSAHFYYTLFLPMASESLSGHEISVWPIEACAFFISLLYNSGKMWARLLGRPDVVEDMRRHGDWRVALMNAVAGGVIVASRWPSVSLSNAEGRAGLIVLIFGLGLIASAAYTAMTLAFKRRGERAGRDGEGQARDGV